MASLRYPDSLLGSQGQGQLTYPGKDEKVQGLPALVSLATAQGSYEEGRPKARHKHTHQISQSPRRAWLILVPQQPLGFFTLCLQGLTCIFLQQFHFLPPYKRLLDL